MAVINRCLRVGAAVCVAALTGCGSSPRAELASAIQHRVIGKNPPARWTEVKTASFITLLSGGNVNLANEFFAIPQSVGQVKPSDRAYYGQVVKGLGVLVKDGYLTRVVDTGSGTPEWRYEITKKGHPYLKTNEMDVFNLDYEGSYINTGSWRSVRILRYTKPTADAAGVVVSQVRFVVRARNNRLGASKRIRALLLPMATTRPGEAEVRKWNTGWRMS